MRFVSALLLASLLAVSACSSHRPVYSGHEESTEGVPGFVNGKKVSPNVKLGQSYTVDGETYVPRYQPDYVEEGDASWYGPGFHGGQTANGESFDKYEMTAAHRTLPLPSIVRVTLLSTGKQAYVRINDRGPFAKGRIIDLSRAAADAIGLTRVGIGRVRVEYMPRESQRFADLLAEGRDPKTIDVASEVIGHESSVQLASNNLSKNGNSTQNWLSHLNPVASANAATPTNNQPPSPVKEPAPVADDSIASADLLPPNNSPFSVLDQRKGQEQQGIQNTLAETTAVVTSTTDPPSNLTTAATPPPKPPPAVTPPTTAPPVVVANAGGSLQLGAFVQQSNAERLQKTYSKYGNISVLRKQASNGMNMFFVRMGPFATADESAQMLAKLHGMGVEARTIKE